MLKNFTPLLFCLLLPSPLFAQLAPPDPQPVIGARQPALSPDGKQIAFVYRGDIWTASSSGGRATLLTQHLEMDSNPLFSPNGKWISFTSKRTGNPDIHIIPVEGGKPRRITHHGGSEIAYGWSPDGKKLIFSGRRDSQNYSIFTVDIATLRTERLREDYATLNYPNYSPDGQKVVYGRYGFPWYRPRYTGSAAAQIWLLETATGNSRALTKSDRQHLWTRFLDDKTLLTVTVGEPTPSSSKLNESLPKFTDSALRAPNLWTLDLDGKAKQLTTFTQGSVRYPTVATKTGDIAFEHDHDIWFLKRGEAKPQKLLLHVAADEKQTTQRRELLSSGVTEAELSPDGRFFAFGLRGEIWTIPVEKPKGIAARSANLARRLTTWAGDDSDFSWSPDGRRLFFTSDRQFNTRIYEMDLASLAIRPLWNRDEDVVTLKLSPDGQQLGFWVAGKEGGLYTLSVTNGAPVQPKLLVRVPGTHARGSGGAAFEWSPDMKWIAFTKRGENRAANIWIMPAAGGEAINVTRLNANHYDPVWTPDGKHLLFHADREGAGLYILPLTPEAVRADDTDVKFEKPSGPVEVKIDFKDISHRIRRFASQAVVGNLQVASDGLIYFLSEGDIWSVSYDGKETKRLTTGGGKAGLRVSRDAKRLNFVQAGDLYVMPAGGAPAKVTFNAEFERDIAAERRASFIQFWRTYHHHFYDANFHARDWAAIRQRYEPLLESVDLNEEFATLLQMMVGELECSHAELSAVVNGSPDLNTLHLGFTFDYRHAGPGIKVARVPEGAPGSFEKTRIKPGDYVMAINKQPVLADENLYRLIGEKTDREFEFLVNSEPKIEGARRIMYKVMQPAEWEALDYRNRITDLRRRVEEKSGDKIGYLHISAMGAGNQLQFEREAYEYIIGKQAMIIDVRFNRGGNISDTLINMLERKQHGIYRPRDDDPEPSPNRAWEKPIIVLMNEHSYSNGEMFPYAMRQRGLAKIVGMPTPGYVIWTGTFRLTDGTGARIPSSGVYRMDGSNMENNGEKPDVQIWQTPEEWLAGRDPQLDKAIELLMQKK
jgi:tricorn protease